MSLHQERDHELLHVVILILLAILAMCAVESAYGGTFVPITLTFQGDKIPPNGAIFVGEVGPVFYQCPVIAGQCVFMVDAPVWESNKAIYVYPKGHPDEWTQHAVYEAPITVKSEKRRAVHH